VIAFAPGMVDTPGIRSVAEGLAPRLGMTAEQFLGLSLHKAYSGLMPASHAAAATAYLVVKLAGEFHGEVVNGYAVLERAGLIGDGAAATPRLETPGRGTAPQPNGAEPANARAGGPSHDRSDHVVRALALSQQLHAILVQTEAEFDRLPVFVRPMARGGFKSKTGQRIQDWIRAMVKLGEQMQHMQTTHTGTDAEFLVDYPRMVDWLGRLVGYFDGVPGETARFTKDEELLRSLAQQMAERIAVTHTLVAELTALHGACA